MLKAQDKPMTKKKQGAHNASTKLGLVGGEPTLQLVKAKKRNKNGISWKY
jgi:hypothetical protein